MSMKASHGEDSQPPAIPAKRASSFNTTLSHFNVSGGGRSPSGTTKTPTTTPTIGLNLLSPVVSELPYEANDKNAYLVPNAHSTPTPQPRSPSRDVSASHGGMTSPTQGPPPPTTSPRPPVPTGADPIRDESSPRQSILSIPNPPNNGLPETPPQIPKRKGSTTPQNPS